MELGTIDKFRTFILQESERCGVLVYANGKEYEQLKNEDNITAVSEVDSHLPFETMDAKVGPRYPVYLISENFGTRGINFRAVNSDLGITLLILGSFPDPTTRLQTLKRVGRFTDKCTRVQDTSFPEYDTEKLLKYRGQITGALEKIIKGNQAKALKGNIPEGSRTEYADKHLSNGQYL